MQIYINDLENHLIKHKSILTSYQKVAYISEQQSLENMFMSRRLIIFLANRWELKNPSSGKAQRLCIKDLKVSKEKDCSSYKELTEKDLKSGKFYIAEAI